MKEYSLWIYSEQFTIVPLKRKPFVLIFLLDYNICNCYYDKGGIEKLSLSQIFSISIEKNILIEIRFHNKLWRLLQEKARMFQWIAN